MVFLFPRTPWSRIDAHGWQTVAELPVGLSDGGVDPLARFRVTPALTRINGLIDGILNALSDFILYCIGISRRNNTVY